MPRPYILGGREGLVAASGLFRWATALAPGLVEPDGTACTAHEREQMRLMANWNFGDPAVLDETNRIADNARKVQASKIRAFLATKSACGD